MENNYVYRLLKIKLKKFVIFQKEWLIEELRNTKKYGHMVKQSIKKDDHQIKLFGSLILFII